jgi:hypothetical protein
MIGACLVAAVALTACASRPPPSKPRVDPRFAAYNADYHVVWTAITSELREAFKWGLEVEDATGGRIETSWKRVENTADGLTAGLTAQYVFRVRVQVVAEGSGWRIDLDGEAALYRPNLTMLQPFKHGDVDEPPWVPKRIAAVRTALHKRLEPYATLSKPTIVL